MHFVFVQGVSYLGAVAQEQVDNLHFEMFFVPVGSDVFGDNAVVRDASVAARNYVGVGAVLQEHPQHLQPVGHVIRACHVKRRAEHRRRAVHLGPYMPGTETNREREKKGQQQQQVRSSFVDTVPPE